MKNPKVPPDASPDDEGGAAPLEGELLCKCGQLEGLHRADRTCELSACVAFEPADGTRIEYDDAGAVTRG